MELQRQISDASPEPLTEQPHGAMDGSGRGGMTQDEDRTDLVFVTGASRSGTTVLARMLGRHSAVLMFQELHYFGSLWNLDRREEPVTPGALADQAAQLLARQTKGLWGGQPTRVEQAWGRRLVRNLPPSALQPAALFAAVLARLTADAGKRMACEQTPRNIFYARQLLALYPHARLVHIVRDPRAVLASQKHRWKLRQLGAEHLPVGEMIRNWVNYHPFTMSQLWLQANLAALQLRDHPRVLLIRFEDLAQDPLGTGQRLCHFLGLTFEPTMLGVPRWGSSNLAHSSELLGISRDVVDQWRSRLTKREIRVCERLTAPLMPGFGYRPEHLGRGEQGAMLASWLSYPAHILGVMLMNPRRAWIQWRACQRGGGSGLS